MTLYHSEKSEGAPNWVFVLNSCPMPKDWEAFEDKHASIKYSVCLTTEIENYALQAGI